jgi:metal-sulfur cluster biosynthetic enzyme
MRARESWIRAQRLLEETGCLGELLHPLVVRKKLLVVVAHGQDTTRLETDERYSALDIPEERPPSAEIADKIRRHVYFERLVAVLDPEIGINIVDLGLLYGVEKDGDGKVSIEMTLTTMGCPLTELLHQQCTLVLTRLPGVEDVEVNFVFSPPWSTDMISDDARLELQAMGFNV